MYVKVTETCGHIYSDQTDRFQVQSSHGYKYILIFYNVGSNAIISCQLKTNDGRGVMDNILNVITLLTAQGYNSKLYQLDNEIRTKLKTLLKLAFIKFQLVSPNNQRCNAAKQAIQT